jgi:hypothetical protein
MFLSIINEGFRFARANVNKDEEEIFSFIFKRFQRWTGKN